MMIFSVVKDGNPNGNNMNIKYKPGGFEPKVPIIIFNSPHNMDYTPKE